MLKMLFLLSVLCFSSIGHAHSLDSILGRYILDSGADDCYQMLDVNKDAYQGLNYAIKFDGDISATFRESSLNRPQIDYQEGRFKGKLLITFDPKIDAFEYAYKGVKGLIPFHYNIFLRKVGTFGLILKIDSFHYDQLLGRKMSCRYVRD